MENINEFEISMVCYNVDNKYTIEEIQDMLTDWAESKNLCLGGSVRPYIEEQEPLSECCGYPVILHDICSKCREHV